MITTPTMQELLEAGVHFGHKSSRGNPRMQQYIYGAREGVHIIDLAQSEKLLREACEFAYELGKNGKNLIFVGTKKQAKSIVEESAKSADAMYLSEKWVPGFLTNFDEILKNIKKMTDVKEQKEKGLLSKYTKKEQLLMSREVDKLESIFGGVKGIQQVPDAIFIVDTVKESTAVKECIRKGIKLIATADTNSDPKLIDYPIPGNDDAIKAIKVVADAIANSYAAGKKAAGKTDAEIKAQEKEVVKKEKKDEKIEKEEEIVIAEELLAEVAAAEEEVEKASLEDSERKA